MPLYGSLNGNFSDDDGNDDDDEEDDSDDDDDDDDDGNDAMKLELPLFVRTCFRLIYWVVFH